MLLLTKTWFSSNLLSGLLSVVRVRGYDHSHMVWNILVLSISIHLTNLLLYITSVVLTRLRYLELVMVATIHCAVSVFVTQSLNLGSSTLEQVQMEACNKCLNCVEI